MKKRLFRSLLMLSFVMLYGFTQAQSISGTVSDANGPLPGATVLVKGTSNGTTTDFDGKYTLSEVSSDAILVVSFVGYITQEVNVAGQSTVDITLVEDANVLSEVVVVGYTTQTRGDITGSVASVDMSEAVKTPMANAAEALQGRVSGVSVVSNGDPGSAPKVTIRGFGTHNNSNPLYIIDGVQTDDASVLNSINPADIDQMNVLKDGAAAIYGARASNGVVIITTKSGGYNMDKATLSVDMYTGAAKAINLPGLLNSQQHGDMIFQSIINTGGVPDHVQYGNGATAVVPSQLQGTGFLVSPDTGLPIPVNVSPGGTDWLDEIMQVGQTQNASVSLQNGTATGKYYMSASFLNREGIQLNGGFKRGSTRLNSEFKISDKVRIGEHVNASFSRSATPGNQVNGALRMNPLVPIVDAEGNFAGGYANPNELGNTANPVAVLERGKNNYNKLFRIFGDVYLEADLMDGLTAKTSLSGSIASFDRVGFTALDPEAAESISTNRLVEEATSATSWTWTNTLNYKKDFDEHSLNVLVGVEALKNSGKGHTVSRTGFLFETPDFYLLNNGSGTPSIGRAFDGSNTLYSFFGSANYSYASKYFVTATVRRDKSSRFKGDNQTGVFPSFSAGWALSKEDFYPQEAIVNRVKFKASYGELGNQTLPDGILTSDVFSLDEERANYALNGSSIATGAFLSSVGNENLRWETSKSTNIGVDLGLFNNALSMSLEWFNITTDGLIVQDGNAIPATGPDGDAPFVNKGDVKNTGIDFSMGYNNTTDSGLSYNISANLSSYKNEVTLWIVPLPGGSFRNGSVTRIEEGQPFSYFYGRVVEGIFASEAEVASAPDQNFPSDAEGVGRFRYSDINGDGTINDDDRTKIGSPHPDFTYGINLGADYKGFDISAFFQGSQGNDIYNYEKIFTDFPTFFNVNRSTRVLDSWTPTNTGASLPALRNNIINEETTSNSFFVEDGSYLRLKNLQLGYTFPDTSVGKLGMESLRFYLQGTNLVTLTGYDGLDPEINNTSTRATGNTTLGVDFNNYPVSRILSLGVNIKF